MDFLMSIKIKTHDKWIPANSEQVLAFTKYKSRPVYSKELWLLLKDSQFIERKTIRIWELTFLTGKRPIYTKICKF
jgi:hypothetical protein